MSHHGHFGAGIKPSRFSCLNQTEFSFEPTVSHNAPLSCNLMGLMRSKPTLDGKAACIRLTIFGQRAARLQAVPAGLLSHWIIDSTDSHTLALPGCWPPFNMGDAH